jgi:Holliday junction resolvase
MELSIDEMKLVIQEGDHEQLLKWAQGEHTDEYVEIKNPYTDEIIRKKKRSSDDLSDDQLRENIQEQLDEINRILSSPLEARIKYFWAEEIDNFDEASLFEAASELPGLEQIIKDFELLQTGFEIIRVGENRKPDLHPDYVNQFL